MEKLDFIELHKEKLAVIFENIDILSTMKESDTQLPPRFFKEITNDVILDYTAKMRILNKNTKFVTKELMKDFRLLRREQKQRQAEIRENANTKRLFTFYPLRSSTRNHYGKHTDGDSRPCAGGVSITTPPRNNVTLLYFSGALWTIKLKLICPLRTIRTKTKRIVKPVIGVLL